MKSLISILIGVVVLAPIPVLGLDAPDPSPVISPYVEEVLRQTTQRLRDASGDATDGCVDEQAAQRAAQSLRLLFSDLSATAEGAADIARSGCFVHDVQALERTLVDLMGRTVQSAAECDERAAGEYRREIDVLWTKIKQVRRFGLDPMAQVPLRGEGSPTPPRDAEPSDDDLLCPYHSAYAQTSVGNAGCLSANLLSVDPAPSHRAESELVRSIVFLMHGSSFLERGLGWELPHLRDGIDGIVDSAAQFVRSMTITRGSFSFPRFTPSFTRRTYDNVGESGCLGWPSDVVEGGVVTGENVPLQNYYPFVLTAELAQTLAFLSERNEPRWLEYVRELGSGTTLIGDFGFSDQVVEINRDHLAVESSMILAVQDPQERFRGLADNLHEQTLRFASHAARDEDAKQEPALRTFVRSYAFFLSGMCTNRGCDRTLARAVDMSQRNECFSSFFMDQFFRKNPSARTLPTCRAALGQ